MGLVLDYGKPRRRRVRWSFVTLIGALVIGAAVGSRRLFDHLAATRRPLSLQNACTFPLIGAPDPTYLTRSRPQMGEASERWVSDGQLREFRSAVAPSISRNGWATLFVGRRRSSNGSIRLVSVELANADYVRSATFKLGTTLRRPHLVSDSAVEMDAKTREALRLPDIRLYRGVAELEDPSHFLIKLRRMHPWEQSTDLLKNAHLDFTIDGWLLDDDKVKLALRGTLDSEAWTTAE
jgi:hypothetical protein